MSTSSLALTNHKKIVALVALVAQITYLLNLEEWVTHLNDLVATLDLVWTIVPFLVNSSEAIFLEVIPLGMTFLEVGMDLDNSDLKVILLLLVQLMGMGWVTSSLVVLNLQGVEWEGVNILIDNNPLVTVIRVECIASPILRT
jgi:hypothetical protein